MTTDHKLSARLAAAIGVSEAELGSMEEAAKIAAARYYPLLIEANRAIKETTARAERAEESAERWHNNFDNTQVQVTDLSAEVEKLKRVLGDGVRVAAAMNMTAGWVDTAKQILGGKS